MHYDQDAYLCPWALCAEHWVRTNLTLTRCIARGVDLRCILASEPETHMAQTFRKQRMNSRTARILILTLLCFGQLALILLSSKLFELQFSLVLIERTHSFHTYHAERTREDFLVLLQQD